MEDELKTILQDLRLIPVSSFILGRLKFLWNRLQEYRDELDIKQIFQAEAMRMHPDLYEYMRYHLEKCPIEVSGTAAKMMTRNLKGRTLTIPVCEVWVGSDLQLPPIRDKEIHREYGWDRSDYVIAQTKLGKRLIEDNITFEARAIQIEPSCAKIEGALTTYCSALATQDALEYELLTETAMHFSASNDNKKTFPKLMGKLKKRLAAERSADNYLLEGTGRCNALAISTVIIYQDTKNDYKIMFGKRSGETGAHADLFHVIPACMFQPEVGDVDAEWNVHHNVLKEYAEELFSENIDPKAENAKYFYDKWPSVIALRQALDEGKCKFMITGLVVNILNLRPEICTLLLVNDISWWQQEYDKMSKNWEYLPKQKILEQHEKARTFFRLESVEEELLDYSGSNAGMWVPPGLAALWLGVDAARRELGIDSKKTV